MISKYKNIGLNMIFTGITACGPNAKNCWNTEGSYKCSCKNGFTGWNSLSGCSDIDECKLGNNSIFLITLKDRKNNLE